MERRNRGELETSVLRILWEAAQPMTARDIVGQFPGGPESPALTTMLTVLNRLAQKHSVVKTVLPAGGLVFSASTPESSYTANAMVSALGEASDRSAALLSFAGELDPRDVEILRQALRAGK